MFPSVIIPTFNRRHILVKCLRALEKQSLSSHITDYEVVVVDDGSTDGTKEWLADSALEFPHVRLFEQEHAGPAVGRNLGVRKARGDLIIFIDSDLIVNESFIASHCKTINRAWKLRGDRLVFTYGAVVNTSNFENPASEKHKFTDLSWAYFATGNVAIDRKLLEQSGLFDTAFDLYGWEDLELGERLRRMGFKLIRCPAAVGFHWHPPLSIEQVPALVRIEKERAKMGLIFYRKHPTLRVRFIVQFTFLHVLLWEFLSLGGLLSIPRLTPLLAWLIHKGHHGLAMEILRIPLNRIGVRAIYKEASSLGFR